MPWGRVVDIFIRQLYGVLGLSGSHTYFAVIYTSFVALSLCPFLSFLERLLISVARL